METVNPAPTQPKCPFFPVPVIQAAQNRKDSPSANGQKQSSVARSAIGRWLLLHRHLQVRRGPDRLRTQNGQHYQRHVYDISLALVLDAVGNQSNSRP